MGSPFVFSGETVKKAISRITVPELKTPTMWRCFTCITVVIAEETHYESDTSSNAVQ